MRGLRLTLTLLFLAPLLGCPKKDDSERLTAAEAKEATEQASLATKASNLTADSIELSTDFTIGEGVAKAAENLAEFWRSQVPCTTVSLEGGDVTVDYGTLDDGCEWRGKTYAGTHLISIGRAEEAGIQVSHTWTEFTNGEVTVSGDATVDWNFGERTRSVAHQLTWTGPKGKQMVGAGDRTQAPLEGGGLKIDGTREWRFDDREWKLTIEGVEVRARDPLPQAGTYTLDTSRFRLILGFERVSDTVIKVTLGNGKREFSFKVRSTGIEEA